MSNLQTYYNFKNVHIPIPDHITDTHSDVGYIYRL